MEGSLVCFFAFGDASVDGLAAGETFVSAMPVGNGFFAQFPAEKNDLAFDLAGKIEQADAQVFDLHADGIDFGESVAHALLGFGALGFAARDGNDVDESATVEEDAVVGGLHLGLDFVH